MYESLVRTRFVRLFSGERVQTLFKLAYLWLVLLSFNSFFAETVLLSYGSYALALFGAPIVLARIIDYRAYWERPLVVLMCLFLASFLVSALNTAEYGITQNIQGFAWMTFEFFILFAHSMRESVESAYAELAKIAKSVCWYAFACSCLGLAMAIVGYSDSVDVSGGSTNYFGVYVGRLWGVYSDPNIGAVVCVLAVLFAFWLYVRSEAGIVFAAANLVVQSGYISLSGSRGSLLCILVAVFVVVVMHCGEKYSEASRSGRVMKTVGFTAIACVLAVAYVFLVGVILQKGSVAVQAFPGYEVPKAVISELYPSAEDAYAAETIPSGDSSVVENLDEVTSEPSEVFDEPAVFDGSVDMDSRFDSYGSLNVFSAGRILIWESALEIFESSPLVGVSHRNILAYSQDVLPLTFVALLGYTTMHNILLDVLVSQGILGFAIFILMMGLGLKRVLVFLTRRKDDGLQRSILASILGAICVAAMFYTEILYINSPASIIFWIVLGFICSVENEDEAVDEHA